MRELDRSAFTPLQPPRRGELERFADRAAHFISCNFVFALQLTETKPEEERFTAEEFRGAVAERYACGWTVAHCRRNGFDRTTEKLFVLSRIFEKSFQREPVEAIVRADEAYRAFLGAGEAMRQKVEAGTFAAEAPLAPDTLDYHAVCRGMESAARLAAEVGDGAAEEVVGPEIAALEELLAAARRFGRPA